jgi:hypothetical protein
MGPDKPHRQKKAGKDGLALMPRDGARSADWRASARTALASHGRSQQVELKAPALHTLARFRSICSQEFCPIAQTRFFYLSNHTFSKRQLL